MSNIKNLFEGWKNHIFPSGYMKESIKLVSDKRMAICRDCFFNSKNNSDANPLRPDEHCTDCGCTLLPKTKCLSCFCPQDKWGPEMTSEEEQIIEENEKIVQSGEASIGNTPKSVD